MQNTIFEVFSWKTTSHIEHRSLLLQQQETSFIGCGPPMKIHISRYKNSFLESEIEKTCSSL